MYATVRIHAIGVNRIDLLQLAGQYPSIDKNKVPGIEVAGTRLDTGERVFALLTSGGYNKEIKINKNLLYNIPDNIDYINAAAIPEAIVTTWLNLYKLGNIHHCSNIFIHGGANGICSTMIQFALSEGKNVLTTSRYIKKLQYLKNFKNCQLVALDRFDNNITQKILNIDLIVDILGDQYFNKNLSILAQHGRLISTAVMSCKTSKIDLAKILMKNLTIIGSTLVNKSIKRKTLLFKEACNALLPKFTKGIIKPLISRTYKFSELQKAHDLLKSNGNIGKVVLTLDL